MLPNEPCSTLLGLDVTLSRTAVGLGHRTGGCPSCAGLQHYSGHHQAKDGSGSASQHCWHRMGKNA